MRKIGLLLILFLLPMVASADKSGKCGDNLNYAYNSQEKSLTISGLGDMYSYDVYGSLSVMPPFPSDVKSIVIENGVTSIGLFAFSGMTELTSVKIPSSISMIDKYSFRNCSNVNSISSDIVNPSSVTLGYDVFGDIPTTAKLTVPMGTKNRYSAASGWNRFTNIVEPDIASGKCGTNVSYFYERTTYTLHISGNGPMWDIDDPDYYPWNLYRSEIQNVKIESGVTNIGDYAFFGCSGLISAFIPSSVSSIGMYAFSGCSKLETVTSEITKPYNIYDNDIFVGIPSDAKLIVPYGYKNVYESSEAWNKFTNVVEQETKSGKCGEHVNYLFKSTDYSLSIYGMGDMYAFDVFGTPSEMPPFPSSTQTIVISPSVTSIGSFAFYGFTNLISAVIPKTVTKIQSMAFYNCSSLECVLSDIDDPFDISNNVFDGIPSTAVLLVPKGTKALYEAKKGWNRFSNIIESVFEVDGISYKRSVDNSVSVVAGDEKYAGKIVIPSQVTYEGKTYNVTSVSSTAFKDCSGLTSVYLPEGLTAMGSMMFSGCTSLTCLNIPNSVTYIGTEFTYGSKLDKVVIGSGIQKLVQLAIGRKQTALAVLATTPPDFDVDQFTVDYIYVPKGCITAYKDAWSGPITDILEIVKGDVNLDGEANKDDIEALVAYIMGYNPCCFFESLADLNGDKKVDSVDLVELIDIIK